MSTTEQVAPAVAGAHTVFLVTNYWENASGDSEINQGKAVTDACKAAGVKHLIFSSLLNVTDASKGRLSHIHHFDGKAKIEEYIRNSGVPATFVLPGLFMSNMFGMIQKTEEGGYKLALPVTGDKGQIPLFNVRDDLGKFVNAAIKHDDFRGKRIYACTDYYTPNRLVSEFSEVIGQPAEYEQVPDDVFRSWMSAEHGQEMLENMKLLDDPGYYGGADLKETQSILDKKPTSWKEFVQTYRERWE
jgi:uncharacterized protein YbjT (DUF2867 family)